MIKKYFMKTKDLVQTIKKMFEGVKPSSKQVGVELVFTLISRLMVAVPLIGYFISYLIFLFTIGYSSQIIDAQQYGLFGSLQAKAGAFELIPLNSGIMSIVMALSTILLFVCVIMLFVHYIVSAEKKMKIIASISTGLLLVSILLFMIFGQVMFISALLLVSLAVTAFLYYKNQSTRDDMADLLKSFLLCFALLPFFFWFLQNAISLSLKAIAVVAILGIAYIVLMFFGPSSGSGSGPETIFIKNKYGEEEVYDKRH